MTYQPFFIGNQRVGQETDLDPYLLPDDAYPFLGNAYLYRGVLRKKGGSDPFGRLGVRNDAYPYNATLIARNATPQTYAGNLLSAPIEPGSLVITDGITTFTDNGIGGFTVTGSGTPGGTINYTTGAFSVQFTAANNTAPVTATYFVVVGANSPCMGLCTYDVQSINNDSLIGFDLTQAYLYDNSIEDFRNISTYKIGPNQTTTTNALTWHGTNSQFFSYENFQGAFFATNNVPGNNFYAVTNISIGAGAQITTASANNYAIGDIVYINNVVGTVTVGGNSINNQQLVVTAAGNPFTVAQTTAGTYTSGGIVWEETKSATNAGDGIRWYDGTGWVNFSPALSATFATGPTYPNLLQGGLLLFAYKGRLVVLSTWEGPPGTPATNYQQRARWSQNGTVFYGSVFPQGKITSTLGSAWYTSSGFGGFTDAPTGESIVSAEFIKDTLVVYFERSTYKLVYTANSAFPFAWQKINTEIGCESTWSVVPFDKEILSIGPNGIYACDSVNIIRVDQKIPDTVFNFGNASSGTARVNGIRDFYSQFAYWSFVDPTSSTSVFPNSILAYNYIDQSFATFGGSYTCFGHYQAVTNRTWGNTAIAWDAMDTTWSSASLQTEFPFVVAGNQQGFVVELNLTSANNDQTLTNAETLVIQNITNANPSVFTVPNHNLANASNIMIVNTNTILDDSVYLVVVINSNTFTLLDENGLAVTNNTWVSGGNIVIIDQFLIKTKKFTPFIESGQKLRIGYIDILFSTDNGLEDDEDEENEPQFQLQLIRNETFESTVNQIVELQDEFFGDSQMFWKRIYLNQTCQSFSLNLKSYFDPAGIYDPNNAASTFQIHGMILWMAPAGRLVRGG